MNIKIYIFNPLNKQTATIIKGDKAVTVDLKLPHANIESEDTVRMLMRRVATNYSIELKPDDIFYKQVLTRYKEIMAGLTIEELL